MRRVLLLVLVVGTAAVLLSSPASAGRDTIHVPGPGSITIQEGIDQAFAAGAGSIVMVAAGTYSTATGEAFPIVMKSGVILRSESGADFTIIDANEEERVMTLTGTAAGTQVEGFTLQDGENLGPGAGVLCEDSSVLFLQCVFLSNETPWDYGGGLSCTGSSFLEMVECHLEGNKAWSDIGSEGGALHCVDPATCELTDCTFFDNYAYVGGGAISVSGPSATLDGCIFWGNRANHGGAITTSSDSFTATGCTFYGNYATTYEMFGGSGGAMYLSSGLVDIENCTFADNWASAGSGTARGGAIYCYPNATLTLTNTIIAFCTSGEAVYWGVPVMSCSDIFGNAGGPGSAGDQIGTNGNFADDPLFCRDDAPSTPYALKFDSPCTAANSPAGCGLIGAWEVGCGGSPVEATSWGHIKGLYR